MTNTNADFFKLTLTNTLNQELDLSDLANYMAEESDGFGMPPLLRLRDMAPNQHGEIDTGFRLLPRGDLTPSSPPEARRYKTAFDAQDQFYKLPGRGRRGVMRMEISRNSGGLRMRNQKILDAAHSHKGIKDNGEERSSDG